MTKNDSCKHALIEIAKLQIVLNSRGGTAEDGLLFEEVLNLQDGILKNFGLPDFPKYKKYISFEKFPSDDELSIFL